MSTRLSFDRSTSAGRYRHRQHLWAVSGVRFPALRHHLWWLLHNVVSHPVLGFWPNERCVRFHDWTSRHLNRRRRIFMSDLPFIPSNRRGAWLWHNVVGHLAIGLFPIRAAFDFHDRTANSMGVKDWV